ncbi:MAG TPA: exodeoxyribonuclease VII large subunit [bacterium]|nr:MAG: Exodeoxyribonuclease 7 large subunit [Parcubacteria group bacterium ADurb.Bin192]HPN15269.1 exodeoxyribonuclease VII large subunit [bacterium]
MTVFSVSDFIAHVNDVLDRSWDAQELCVEGEVSSFRISQGQWVNFDLKDEQGLVNVFMTVWQLRVPVEDGMKVRVYGSPRIYAKFGKFSLTASKVELTGEGALKKALAALRARLEAEGLFDVSRKRTLPVFPNRIALIASRESAAYGDFVRVLKERWSGLEIDLYHVKVQGLGAPEDLIKAITLANKFSDKYDVLVMTRGGGSLEELMAFNDEFVVRAVYASKIPTLIGIGHERDLSLVELAADERASTPTDCARRVVLDKKDVLRDLAYRTGDIEKRVKDLIASRQDLLSRSLSLPAVWLTNQKALLNQLSFLCGSNAKQWLDSVRERLQSSLRLLRSLDPKNVLLRGYAILTDEQGRAVASIKSVSRGSVVGFTLQDGSGTAQIKDLELHKQLKQSKLF